MPSTPNAARMTGLNAARTSGAACARSASPGFGEPRAGEPGQRLLPAASRLLLPCLLLTSAAASAHDEDEFIDGGMVLLPDGGMMATLADMLLLLGTNIQAKLGQFLLTVSLDIDFVAPVKEGDWLEGRAQVLRAGKSVIFSEGRMTVGGATVARVNAILKPSGRPLADFAPGRFFT